MNYRKGDRIIITEKSHCIEQNLYIEPGHSGKVVAEDKRARGTVVIELDYDEYQMDAMAGGHYSFWGPFSMTISKSRIKLDTKRNRDNKIDSILNG